MTTQQDLKNHVRARMEKTGESYAAARRHVVTNGDPRDARPGDPSGISISALGERIRSAIYTYQAQSLFGMVEDELRGSGYSSDTAFWREAACHVCKTLSTYMVALDAPPTPSNLRAILSLPHAEFLELVEPVTEMFKAGGMFGDPETFGNVVTTLFAALESVSKSRFLCPHCDATLGFDANLHIAGCNRDHDREATSDLHLVRTWGMKWALAPPEERGTVLKEFSEKRGCAEDVCLAQIDGEMTVFIRDLPSLEAPVRAPVKGYDDYLAKVKAHVRLNVPSKEDLGIMKNLLHKRESPLEQMQTIVKIVHEHLKKGTSIILFAPTGAGSLFALEELAKLIPGLRTPGLLGGFNGITSGIQLPHLYFNVGRYFLGAFLAEVEKGDQEFPFLCAIQGIGPVPTQSDFEVVVNYAYAHKKGTVGPKHVQENCLVVGLGGNDGGPDIEWTRSLTEFVHNQ